MISASTLLFHPLLPVPLLVLAIGPALLVCIYALVRRVPGSLWRLLAVLVLALVLLNPALVTEQRSPLRDVALVVVDHSPSQQLAGRPAQTEKALTALRSKLASLPDLDVRVIDSPTGGDETQLFKLADQALADVPENRRAGVIFISDGQIHDVPAAADAPHYGPVHVLLTGSRTDVDRRLTIIQAPGYGIVGQSVRAIVRVEDLPGKQSETATLLIHNEDGSTDERHVTVGSDVELDMPVSHAGLNLLGLEVAPVEGEISPANNRAALMVNGVRDRLRVLLISGMPHNGERVWRNLLKSDPAVDLVHFTILRTPYKNDYVPESEISLIPFPVHELFAIKLRQFDLVIFDRFNDRSILAPNYMLNIADFVRAGGAVLDASGSDLSGNNSLAQTPLGALLPSTPTGQLSAESFAPTVTAMGLRHPITAALPGLKPDGTGNWGPWEQMSVVTPGPDAQILMAGANTAPLLLLGTAGEGRLAQLTSEQIWLWGRGYGGGGPQVELLRPLIHWLMKEPKLEAERLVGEQRDNRLHITRHSLTPNETPVEVTLPDGTIKKVDMHDDGHIASGSLEVSDPGIYRLNDTTHSTLALIGKADAPELRDQRASPTLLEPVMKASGGGAYWLADMPEGPELKRVSVGRLAAGRHWLGLAANGGYSVSGFTTLSLLPALLVAALTLGGLLVAWRREGK